MDVRVKSDKKGSGGINRQFSMFAIHDREESCEYAYKLSRRADALQKQICKKYYIEYFKERPESKYTGIVTGFTRYGAPIITLDDININATLLM